MTFQTMTVTRIHYYTEPIEYHEQISLNKTFRSTNYTCICRCVIASYLYLGMSIGNVIEELFFHCFSLQSIPQWS